MNFRDVMANAFLYPIRHRGRALTFFGLSFGLFGFGLISMTQLYSLVTTNPAEFTQYVVALIAFESFVMSPLVYYFFRCHDGIIFRLSLLLVLCLGLVGLVALKPTGLVLGLFVGALFGTLFPAHHSAMLANTTEGKRGFEAIFSQTLSTLFSIGSAMLGAYWLTQHQEFTGFTVGCIAMIVGISLIFFASPWLERQPFAGYRREVTQSLKHKDLINLCLRFGSYDCVMWIGAAIAAVAGFSPLATGTINAVSAVATVALAPAMGYFIHQGKNREMVIGHLFVLVGWVLIIILPNTPVYFTLGMLLNSFGYQAIIPSLQAGWYDLKMPGAVMVKEASLGITRVIFVFIASQIVTLGIDAFFALMLLPLGYSLFVEIKKTRTH